MSSEVPYQALPVDQSDVHYAYGPDSTTQPGVRQGQTVSFVWSSSRIYPGTSRTVWVHVPAGWDPNIPAGLMVFQDGWWYLDPAGDFRVGVVLDNLVHANQIPPTIGVFIDPGIIEGSATPKNRNVEYDAFNDRYATFLLEEILPQVSDRYDIRTDPTRRGLCGGSSGGNCSFTAAWFRPDQFSRVIGFLSSFAQMPGGNPYPTVIAETARRPLKVFLQAGHRDLNWNRSDMNWLAENLRVAAALAVAGYDFRLTLGEGGHSPNHGGVLLPDALRWLWSDHQA